MCFLNIPNSSNDVESVYFETPINLSRNQIVNGQGSFPNFRGGRSPVTHVRTLVYVL